MIIINQLKKYLSFPRRYLNILIILATLGAAVYYFSTHRHMLTNLKKISPSVGIEVLALYILMLGVLVVVYKATMRLVNIKLPLKENSLINGYSLFMNYFIPGQTGVVFRAYYMKKNYSLKYLDYTVATIIYYLIYAILCIFFIMAGSQPYFLTVPVVIVSIIAGWAFLKLYLKRKKQARLNLSPKNILILTATVVCQLVLQALIFFIELHSVKHGMRLGQIMTYTGTANLALFIALTPGAIGIREGFLILTERLNHISSSTIILANVIDRSVYLIFLLLLGVAIAGLKIKERLGVNDKTN